MLVLGLPLTERLLSALLLGQLKGFIADRVIQYDRDKSHHRLQPPVRMGWYE